MATKDSNGYFEYIRTVRSAKLKAREKNLLYFYASMYDWDNASPSFAGIELIAAWTGMSIATVNRAKKRLKELGWIRDYRKDRYSKVYVWVTRGIADTAYEMEEFAKFHRYAAVPSIPSIEDSDGFDLSELSETLRENDETRYAFMSQHKSIDDAA